jgi:hypothetical protein
METYSRDPLINGIQQGIKRGIDVTIENKCYGSAIILIYSAIDAMAHLGLPSNREDVHRGDFVTWADRYIKFPCVNQVTGLEFYGARCAMLHSYGVVSKLKREGRIQRNIAYSNDFVPAVYYRPDIETDLVFVSIHAFRDALFHGIDRYLVDLFADPARRPDAERRLGWIMTSVEMKPQSPAK